LAGLECAGEHAIVHAAGVEDESEGLVAVAPVVAEAVAGCVGGDEEEQGAQGGEGRWGLHRRGDAEEMVFFYSGYIQYIQLPTGVIHPNLMVSRPNTER